MTNAPNTTIQPYRDWPKLLREARAAGVKEPAIFIWDNTKDRRADTEAPVYMGWIETWLKESVA